MICSFIDEYKFLSPRSLYEVTIEDLKLNHLEDLIYACFVRGKNNSSKFSNLEEPIGNRYHFKFWLRGDWQRISEQVVLSCTFQKFYQNKDLISKLLDTGNETLVYVSPFNDKFLGVSGEGSLDLLGVSLVKVRNIFKKGLEENFNNLTYELIKSLMEE